MGCSLVCLQRFSGQGGVNRRTKAEVWEFKHATAMDSEQTVKTLPVTWLLLVFVQARNKVYLEVRECHNRQLPLLEFGNGPTTSSCMHFVQQLACCRFCVMQSLALLLPRQLQQAEVSLALLTSTVHPPPLRRTAGD